MKNYMKKTIATAVVFVLMLICIPVGVSAENGDTVVLFTNDVHCTTENYAILAAYREELIAKGHTVVTVDAGDHIQGEVIGSLTQGAAIIELMDSVGYDFAVPGNHEFDYGMDSYMDLSANAKFKYLSCNFTDLRTGNTVFDSYEIVELNGTKYAFLGITTPECYTKSTPAYFQDEAGSFIYSFCEQNLYGTIQNSVNSAIADGAECVIAIGHLGIEGTTYGWRSTDVISNTTGIDIFLDGHSHEVIEGDIVKNQDGREILLASAGTKLQCFGQLTVGSNGKVDIKLIDIDSIDVSKLSPTAENAYETVKTVNDGYQAELSYLFEPLGTSEVELSINDADGNWVIRTKETNMGNFVADAYRAVSGADIGFVNGGGVRAAIEAGEVTRKMLMDVNPWNNEMCVIKVTGQQIADALEHGASRYPESSGGFLHVSGMSYEIRSDVDSPVIYDDISNFIAVDDTKERRVVNIKVAGHPIELEESYTLVGSYYMLRQGGDGFTMFEDAEMLEHEALPTDAEMLEKYFTEHLNGVVTKEQYGDIGGEGRIKLVVGYDKVPETSDLPILILFAPVMLGIAAVVFAAKFKKKEA